MALDIWCMRYAPLISLMALLIIVLQDDPAKLAEILVEFWKRNERVVIGVKRVGEI